MLTEDFYHLPKEKCRQITLPPKACYRIVFIVPPFSRYAGGAASILRLGSALSDLGHEIVYVCEREQFSENCFTESCAMFPNFKGEFLNFEEIEEADVAVATFWPTCYTLLRHQAKFTHKAYFIQDFEPYFYGMGAEFLLAQKTYDLGLHMISLGNWNQEKILSIFPKVRVDVIDFPVAFEEYPLVSRKINYSQRPFKIAVYVKKDAKRAPRLLEMQLKILCKKFKENIEITLFGMEDKLLLDGAVQKGRLSHQELRELYISSHFGLVASLTNISLVGYEMIASGLPVIDYKEGSAPSFFSEEEMLFIDTHPNALCEKIEQLLINPSFLKQLSIRAQEKIQPLSWDATAKQFERKIRSFSSISLVNDF